MGKNNYDYLGGFSEGLAPVYRAGRYGYIDKSGQEVIPCWFERGMPFYEGAAMVAMQIGQWDESRKKETGGHWGLIDKTGSFIIPPDYNRISYYSEGRIACENQYGQWIYLDRLGDEAFPLTFEGARPFATGIAIVCQNGKYGGIDLLGNTVIPFEFEEIDDLGKWNNNDMVGAQKNSKYGVIDRSGNTLVDFIYDSACCHRNGLIEVGYKTQYWYQYKYGIITAEGDTVLPCIYDAINCMQENIGINIGEKAGSKNFYPGKWGWSNLKGNIIVEPKYCNEMGIDFSEGLAEVVWRKKSGFANQAGDIVIPFRYDMSTVFEDGLALVRYKGRNGFIDKNGDFVIPPIYDFLSIFMDDYAVAELGSEKFYIDKAGQRVLF